MPFHHSGSQVRWSFFHEVSFSCSLSRESFEKIHTTGVDPRSVILRMGGYLPASHVQPTPWISRSKNHSDAAGNLYGKVGNRQLGMVRKPRSPTHAPIFQSGIFVPDLPVPKHQNHPGRCFHQRWPTCMESWCPIGGVGCGERLDLHFVKNRDVYLTDRFIISMSSQIPTNMRT